MTMKLAPFAASLTLLVSSAALAEPRAPRASPVRTAVVEEASVTSGYFVPGTVRPAEDARLAAEISGKLEWVAELGAEVARGEVVARMDASRLLAERARQTAEVRRLEAMVQLRTQVLSRQGRLDERGIAVGVEVDQAEAELAMAKQDLAGAKANLQRIREDVKRTKLRAPFDGQIVERLAQRGEFPREGTAVVRLVAVRRLEIWAEAPISVTQPLERGAVLKARSQGREFSARIEAIVQTGSALRRVTSLRLIPDGHARLSIGGAVEVGIPGRRMEQQTVVPRDALVLREAGAHVMVVDDDNKARRVPVRVGLGEGDRVSVKGAIRPGQVVIRRGAEQLTDGDLVKRLDGPGSGTDEG